MLHPDIEEILYSEEEISALVAFLRSLSGDGF